MKTAAGKNHEVNWITSVALILFHLGAVAALFMFSWKALIITAILYWMAIGFGIGMGYHRLLTHRSYKVPKVFEYFFAVCATLALEGGPIFWVATHRIHHQHSDMDGDPHTPRDGGFWAHLGWIIFGERKHNDTKMMSRYAPDLARDPFYVWLNTYHYVPLVVLGLILLAVGGFADALGRLSPRDCRSTCHLARELGNTYVGHPPLCDAGRLKNSWWVALLTFGEGWHNNHHAHPTSARHGLAWYELDVTWLQISLLESFGIAKAVKIAKVDTELQREAA